MGIKERKEREREEHCQLILNAADEIIAKEGIENLSVRKIATKIEYSPAIIYHYFRDKEEIINILMEKGYKKIIDGLSSTELSDDDPYERLEILLKKYIDMALNMPQEYMNILLNNSPNVLLHTSTLFKGAAEKKQALGILCQCLKDIFKDNKIDDSNAELTAQIIWTSTFGLIIRLIIEKNIPIEQKNLLIEHHIKLITAGIKLDKI